MDPPDRNQAEALISAGQVLEAEALLARLRQLDPGDDDLAFRHAQILHSLGRLEEAIPGYLQAMAAEPMNPRPLKQLGLLLQEAGEPEQAIDLFQQALALAPSDSEALYFLARAHSSQGRIDTARPLYERIAQLDPQDPVAPFSLGHDARQLGEGERALALLERARALVRGQRQPTQWVLEELIFLLSIGPAAQDAAYLAATEEYWRLVREGEGEGPGVEPAAPPLMGEIRERLRVGILSADLGDHVVGSFLGGFLDAYRRDALAVELIATKLRHEERGEALAARAEATLSVHGLGVEESRALLRQRQYDVIVETAGFTHAASLELLAERCAPVQCHWIGYHASTGLDTIDWFLGDGVFTPAEFADQFREKLWRLSRPWLARCQRWTPVESAANGTSGGDPVLGSFNQLAKLGEATLDFWAAALAAVPAARLVIKDRLTPNPSACERIRTALAQRGIDPARLSFRPRLAAMGDHLRAYNGLDIALDTTPWSSSSTAFDALSMGVPLVAIRGDGASARMSSSLLTGIGREEWICGDPAGFAAAVAELCRDLPALRAGRAARQRQVLASPLYDPLDLAQHVGEALQAMRRLAP
jgi:predicted O-linked N-acetylglucosamine transferase (SPINDLY family)